MTPTESWVFAAYVGAFGAAAVACGVAVLRARRVADDDTQRGLVGLLVGSGGWAFFQLLYLVVPGRALKYVAYDASLVVGLATIGGWLYFTSAYTGRTLHRQQTVRRLAVGVYASIVALKLTNPIHGWYFTLTAVESPFPHLAVQQGTVHWVVTGLSYALVAVGFFMLYELFVEADYDTRPLGVLVGVTGLPVAFDLFGFASPLLLDVNYEPLGVAAFALGVLYVYEAEFLAVQLTDGFDDPVVYLDDADRVRSANGRATAVFDALDGATGESLSAVLPDVAAVLDEDQPIVQRAVDGEARFFLVSSTSFTVGQSDVGRMVVFSDVTETERQRRELERQNEQLEGFAAAIRHELLNTLQIVSGHVSLVGDAIDDGDVDDARSYLQNASGAADRMAGVVDDLSVLARHGKTLGETERVSVAAAASDASEIADADIDVSVDGDGDVVADPERLEELFVSAFEFAAHNGAESVTVECGDGWFAVADDGRSLAAFDADALFEYGSAVPDAEAGILLPNVRMLAAVHGWEADLDADYDGGTRVVVSGTDGVVRPSVEAA
ncbi:histidine kinase N-terminal 7TM domain-containing protein [Halobacterium litoreum]|uniref:histidine kinase n=1 Tax=Halobacterium litoreum TaxID=2039234 RepID=A0ABD5NAP5_9EURY|nr:histidine kinase N-terminal 7TM domain-containing protein [Halobacterium litoreum]UHH14713.1 histidine kinase [Halobacterium litoreum]